MEVEEPLLITSTHHEKTFAEYYDFGEEGLLLGVIVGSGKVAAARNALRSLAEVKVNGFFSCSPVRNQSLGQ